MEAAIDVAAAWLRNENGEILICRRAATEPRAGYWEFPGGKFEAGESGAEALVRELREELAIDVHCGAELETAEHSYTNGRFRIHLYACEMKTAQQPTLKVHDALAWVLPKEIRSYKMLPGDIPLIETYLAKTTDLL